MKLEFVNSLLNTLVNLRSSLSGDIDLRKKVEEKIEYLLTFIE